MQPKRYKLNPNKLRSYPLATRSDGLHPIVSQKDSRTYKLFVFLLLLIGPRGVLAMLPTSRHASMWISEKRLRTKTSEPLRADILSTAARTLDSWI